MVEVTYGARTPGPHITRFVPLDRSLESRRRRRRRLAALFVFAVLLVPSIGTTMVSLALFTDQESAASALDISAGSSATGLVEAGRAGSGALLFNRVGKDENVQRGDRIVTRGSREGELDSLYPRGIPIGVATFVGQTDTDPYKRIQLDPYVDFDHLDQSVIVLVPKGRP